LLFGTVFRAPISILDAGCWDENVIVDAELNVPMVAPSLPTVPSPVEAWIASRITDEIDVCCSVALALSASISAGERRIEIIESRFLRVSPMVKVPLLEDPSLGSKRSFESYAPRG